MYFTSSLFWVMLAVVLLVYSFFYKKPVMRNAYLLVVSLFFYYKAGGLFFFMLVVSTLADYFIGKAIFRSSDGYRKKAWLILSIVVNLSILFYFKYAYFISDLLSGLLNHDIGVTNYLALFWNELSGATLDIDHIILPVGISFYTFQTISYSVDVYRGQVKPVTSLLDFGFYVSFFPQLVAGPIVRAASFIPQLYQKYKLTRRQMWHAVYLILGGLLKKMVVADFLAVQVVDKVFQSPAYYSGFENLLSIYSYSVQIFFDFSGYTDIAIGVALLLGFKLPVNFNAPYQSVSITDFWRRWHISLSSWLRDYLYIPMGGNRHGKLRQNINLMITMVLGGLWHGAHWRFLIWGAYHGILLVIEKLLPNRGQSTRLWIRRLFTFHLITIGWVFFRAETPQVGFNMFKQIFTSFGGGSFDSLFPAYGLSLIILIISFLFILVPTGWIENFRGRFITWPYWLKIVSMMAVLFIIYMFQSSELVPFIYFRF